MVIFGKVEDIRKEKKSFKDDVSYLMSGKSYSDENFPVASFLMTKKIRSIVRVFYFFARMADDIADHQNLSTNKKKEILLFFDHSIAKNKKTNNQIINNMISKFKDLPSGKKYSRNLLKAFMMDASNKKYRKWEDLLYYCRFSANPVGRFVIDAVNEKKNIKAIYEASDNLCTALQIINHMQDCQKDFRQLNRVYIPESLLKKYSLNKKILDKNQSSKNFVKLKIEIIDNILSSLKKTKKGLSQISSWRLRKETFIILNIAKRLCNLLKRNDPLKENIKLSRIDFIFCFFKGIVYD
ncbi:MAG: squalene/phytoene synthase family protein [Pseudomonadota bacterium]|nr:squalene/phytoene synthase family protein [Pseudomonadota bacterium]